MNTAPPSSGERRQLRVLIVEDTPMVRKLMVIVLQQQNFAVFEAGNGKEALEKLDEARPDIILCDLSMPEMDGLEFLKRMKSNEATKAIPIAILSADEGRDLKDELLAAGAVELLDKAIPHAELGRIIHKIIESA